MAVPAESDRPDRARKGSSALANMTRQSKAAMAAGRGDDVHNAGDQIPLGG